MVTKAIALCLLTFFFVCIVTTVRRNDESASLEENRGRNHNVIHHSEARFKRAESLMHAALEKAQKFDTNSNIQDESASKDEKIHSMLIREADLAAKNIREEMEKTKKIDLLRCVGPNYMRLSNT
jgi:uncharacterized membrane protein YhiD involved in acid resistance